MSAEWTPETHHQAWEGAVNGGILGALLDCHSNWAAALHLMRQAGGDTLPSHGHRRVPRQAAARDALGAARSRCGRGSSSRRATRATVEATIEAEGQTTATCRGVFVAVPEGHPAYHRW